MILGLVQKLTRYNLNLKIISLLIGFSIWYMFIHLIPAQYSYNIPICFDDEIDAQCSTDSITITLLSSKWNFYTLDKNNLAVHINKNDISDKKNIIHVRAEKLLLPVSFKLIDCCPSTIIITT